jgi:hypothetical protein
LWPGVALGARFSISTYRRWWGELILQGRCGASWPDWSDNRSKRHGGDFSLFCGVCDLSIDACRG